MPARSRPLTTSIATSPTNTSTRPPRRIVDAMDPYQRIHEELTRVGVTLAATLPDDWVGPLIGRLDADPSIIHVPVAREAEAVTICSGAFFGGVRSVAVIGNTGLLT